MNKLEYINIGPKGTFKPSGNAENDTTPEDVDTIISHLENQHTAQVTLYIHGGLVSESSGMESAEIMSTVIKEAQHHPIAFVWESGLIETLKDRFTTIHSTTIFKKILKYVIKRAGGKIGIEVGGKGVRTFSDTEINGELNKRIPFEAYDINKDHKGEAITAIENERVFLNDLEAELEEDFEVDYDLDAILKNLDKTTLIDEEKLKKNPTNGQSKGIFSTAKFVKFVAIICYKVIKRHIKDRDHGFYPTIIEEILREFYIANFGAWVWKGMKDKAKEMWLSNDDQVGLSKHAGSHFLEKLDELSQRQQITLNVVAHSAGSIATCHMLAAIDERYAHINMGKVVFLAPACRSDLFHKEMLSHPDRYKELRIFTMSDAYERKDALVDAVPFLYPRSLLYFVSGLLEDEGESNDQFILGMERYIGWSSYTSRFNQLEEIATFLNTPGKDRLVLSKSDENAPEGQRTTAIDHGAFDNNTEVHQSIIHYLQQ